MRMLLLMVKKFLDSQFDCRFGSCISDKYQNKGIGSIIFPYIVDIAKQFIQKRLLLWGGVFQDNEGVIRFYLKNGFRQLGIFSDDKGRVSIDMIFEIY